MGPFVEQFRKRLFFWTSNGDRLAIDQLRYVGVRVVHVADDNCLGRTHDYARGLKPHVDAVSAEIAFLRRVILGIDEDGIVRASGHTCLAPNTDVLVKIDNSVFSLEHRRGRTGGRTRRMRALVTSRNLKR